MEAQSSRLAAWFKRRKLFLAIVGFAVIFDQITKYWAIGALTRAFDSWNSGTVGLGERLTRFLWMRHPGERGPVEVLHDFWSFNYAENPGAAFSFLAWAHSDFRVPFFLTVSFIAMVAIYLYYRKSTPEQRLLRVGLSLVFGGALGNFLDRARLGYVIDFIDWHWYDKATWPTFNIADAAISIGVGLLLIDMITAPKKSADKAVSGARVRGG